MNSATTLTHSTRWQKISETPWHPRMNYRDEFGTIEAEKVADLVILDGDPLNDHRLVGSRVAALFKDGKLIINNCTLKVAAADMI
jgi:hypothetical protein